MSIKQYTSLWCDSCGRVVSTETAKVSEAETNARRQGWVKRANKEHMCPQCKENQGR